MTSNAPAIVLSGPICAGKTTLARGLAAETSGVHLSTRHALKARKPAADHRRALQALGRELDERTGGRWIAEEFMAALDNASPIAVVIVDSARITEQIDALRALTRVFHIHVTAPRATLERRYAELARHKPHDRDAPSYADLRNDPTEAQVESLTGVANLLIDTEKCNIADTRALALAEITEWGLSRTSH